MLVTELKVMFDARQSFYGKAQVIHYGDGIIELQSYDTIVCRLDTTKRNCTIYGYYSNTTARHIREFLKQMGIAVPQPLTATKINY